MFIFYILTFCIQKFNSLKLAPEPPKGDKMEKDGGSGGRCEPHGQWWEVVGVVGAVGAARAMMGAVGGDGRWWEQWEGVGTVGDSPRIPEGGQAASGGTSNW